MYSLFKKVAIITLFTLILQGNSGATAQAQRVLPQSEQQMQLSFAPVVKRVAPAVVNIYASKRVRVQSSPFAINPLFEEFFGRDPFGGQLSPFRGFSRERVINSLGSGVIVDPEGLIITNYHVVAQGDDIKIVLNDKREFKANVVLTDQQTDLALLKVQNLTEPLPFVPMAQQNTLEVGDIVLAIGNPFGVGQTVTSGIVSALARTAVGIADYEFFIQTDAAINPGNSGGALVDLRGELVGINTAIYSKSGASDGIGFATPAIMAWRVLESYREGLDRIARPWLGASTQNMTQELARSLGLERPGGVLVNNVLEESPAAKGGLQRGDVIITVDGEPVNDEETLKFHIATKPLGTYANLEVLRRGKTRDLQIEMELPRGISPGMVQTLTGSNPLAGVKVANLSPALAQQLRLDRTSGVVVIDGNSERSRSRFFRKGDIIEAINGEPVTTVAQLEALLDEPKRSWNIQADRQGQKLVINLML